MNIHLVSGGCGFVGRNLTKRLLATSEDILVLVDDLSKGRPPAEWLNVDAEGIYEGGKVLFYQQDIRAFLKDIASS